MSAFLVFAFLFFVGSTFGWALELFYRRFFSQNNPQRKWINPGFFVGPYLPLYGTGLCFLYMIASLRQYLPIENEVAAQVTELVLMAAAMTVTEYLAGTIALKLFHVRLWDYSDEWANLNGLICPKFSLYWGILGCLYYYLYHPHVLYALQWLSENLAFSFVIGMFYGFFIIDLVHSTQLMKRLRRLSDEYQVEVRYEQLKTRIRSYQDEHNGSYHFFRPLWSDGTLSEHINSLKDSFKEQKKKYFKRK